MQSFYLLQPNASYPLPLPIKPDSRGHLKRDTQIFFQGLALQPLHLSFFDSVFSTLREELLKKDLDVTTLMTEHNSFLLYCYFYVTAEPSEYFSNYLKQNDRKISIRTHVLFQCIKLTNFLLFCFNSCIVATYIIKFHYQFWNENSQLYVNWVCPRPSLYRQEGDIMSLRYAWRRTVTWPLMREIFQIPLDRTISSKFYEQVKR